MHFLYWNSVFLVNISRILQTLYLIPSLSSSPHAWTIYFCFWRGWCLWIDSSSIHSSNTFCTPTVFTLVPRGWNQWWDGWIQPLLWGSSDSSYAPWSLSSFDSQPVICLLFHMVSQRIQLKSSLLEQFLPIIVPRRRSFYRQAPLLSLQHTSSSFPA